MKMAIRVRSAAGINIIIKAPSPPLVVLFSSTTSLHNNNNNNNSNNNNNNKRVGKGCINNRSIISQLVLKRRKKGGYCSSSQMDEALITTTKIIDSHLHVWASPLQASQYPYTPGQEPTLPGHDDFLLEHMEEAGVDGALIVQPINHKFDHSYVTSVLKKYPSKFVGCCLANPAEDGSGVQQLQNLVLKDGYRAVRFNPYLWPSGQQMTNEVGKALFSKAGELGVPVGFMCFKGLNLHISEIEELCTEFPSTVVILDHLAFCKPPITDEEIEAFSQLLKLSRFPKVNVKFSALFRVSRKAYPYEDPSQLLSQVVSSFGANRVMWGSDFPYVVPECGYKEAKEAVSMIAKQVSLSSSQLEWILGKTVMQLFPEHWLL